MQQDERDQLKQLLTETRTLALAVSIGDVPYVGLLPFVMDRDFESALVHASRLARHSRGMGEDAPFSALIHRPDDGEGDPLQVLRVMLHGTMTMLARGTAAYDDARRVYIERFPSSAPTFELGDFSLYRLRFERGRMVAGFAASANITRATLRELAEGSE